LARLIVASTGNTVPQVIVALGTLQLGANNALPTGTNLRLGQSILNFGLNNDFGTLDLAGFSQQVGTLSVTADADPTHSIIGNSSTAADSTLTVTGTSTYDGIIKDTLGSGTHKTALTVDGTLTLGGANTYTGTTTVSSTGTLKGTGA